QGTLVGRDAVRPDLLIIGQWSFLNNVQWNYTPQQIPFYDDSAVILRWNETRLASNDRRGIATYYGIGDVTTTVGGSQLALNLTAPARLETFSGQLTPNPFEINLIVLNTGASAATGVEARLNLPPGLRLASGEVASKQVTPANINSQQIGIATWKVLAQCPSVDDTLGFIVNVTATNATTISAARTIIIPSCAASLPNFILTATPKSQTVPAGQAANYTVRMQPSGGFVGNVGLSLFPTIPGVAPPIFTPMSINAATSSTLTLQTTTSVAPGNYNFIVAGTGGGLTRSDTVALVVLAGPDEVAPFTINHNPARGARNVPLDTEIMVEVHDVNPGVDSSRITMAVNGTIVKPQITGVPSAYVLRYKPAAPFRDNQTVQVRISARDLASPPNQMTPDDIYSFTTVSDNEPPFTLDHFPARNATNVPSDTKIELRVQDLLTGVNQDSIVLRLNGQRVNRNITGDKFNYLLSYKPQTSFQFNETVNVQIDATDLASTPNRMTDKYVFSVVVSVKDTIPPFTTGHRPAKGATNVPLDTDIRVEVRDELAGVDRNSVTMQVDGQLVSPTITPVPQGFLLQYKPAQNFRYNATVQIVVRARDLAQPANVMTPDTLRFSTMRDVEPPFTTDHQPAKGSSNASPNTNIVLHVRDLVAGVDLSAIFMTVNGTTALPTITGVLQDYKVEYDPPGNFAPGDTVSVSIAAQDLSSPPNMMAREIYAFVIGQELPDLAVTSLQPVGTFFVGLQGEVVGEVANAGSADAGRNFSVQFRVDGGTQKDTTFSRLDAGTRAMVRLPLRFQTTGTHEVELLVDAGDKIREVTEANNSQKLVVQISQMALSNRLIARPNPFTPNNDGYNDQIEFDYSGLALRNPSLQIFDANGIPVWSSHNGVSGQFIWNGRDDRGREVLPGVYLYSVRDQGNNVASGYVVVAR
ncbi:MAG: Ig-like domain-containing protein, partial [bacterium]